MKQATYFSVHKHIKYRGNILFMILLVIVLFAALSEVIIDSTRGGGNDASAENVRILASRMIENASLIENNIQRAQITNNIPEYGFSLNGDGSNSGSNSTCTSTVCRIFLGSGQSEGVPPLIIPSFGRSSTNNGTSHTKASFNISSIVNIGTSQEDVSIQYLQLTRQLCEAINTLVGATDINLNTTTESYNGTWTVYSGTLTSIPISGSVLGDQITAIAGKRTFCFQHGTNGYTFVHVVMTR